MHIPRSTPGSHYANSNHYYTNSTKHLSLLNKLAFNTLHWTSIAQTPPNGPYTHGKIIFLASMAGHPKLFLIANWCCLTTQCNTTLNMLCSFHQNPLLLAHKALEGSSSFNATPMAPLGIEVLAHMKPNHQCTWGYHASKAWYLLHATNHYRCI
jgi:hypothetical protein